MRVGHRPNSENMAEVFLHTPLVLILKGSLRHLFSFPESPSLSNSTFLQGFSASPWLISLASKNVSQSGYR